MAERELRRATPDVTLGTTTLLHETYLSMAARDGVQRGLVIDYLRTARCRSRRAR